MSTRIVFGRGLTGTHAGISANTGILKLTVLKKQNNMGEPFENDDVKEESAMLFFENVQGLDVLLVQLNHIRSEMSKNLPPELRIGT